MAEFDRDNQQSPDTVETFAIFTNGSNPQALREVRRSQVYIRISLHPESDMDACEEVGKLAISRGWRLKVNWFGDCIGETLVPSQFLGLPVFPQRDQMEIRKDLYNALLHHDVLCAPRMVYFGTDGIGYHCEQGLRCKEKRFAYEYSLTQGVVDIPPVRCTVGPECMGSFETEQRIVSLLKEPSSTCGVVQQRKSEK